MLGFGFIRFPRHRVSERLVLLILKKRRICVRMFQKSVIDKYLKEMDKNLIKSSYERFKAVFCHAETIRNIEASKEEQYQEGFLTALFVNCLGYTINPNPFFNLTTEYKNIADNRKADGAIIKDEKPIGVIELKGTDTVDLKKVEKQGFEYRYAHPTCKYVITSNFRELRLYVDTSESYEEFTLFNMEYADFEILYLLLSKNNIYDDKPLKIKNDSKLIEEDISDKLYKDYHRFKMNLFNSMVKNNPSINKVELLKKSQKLLDRILFIFFAEDRGLLPPNTISTIISENKEQANIGREEPLYNTYKIYFKHIDKGHSKLSISEYNGGLFAPDELLDNLIIEDAVLKEDALKISSYDFSTDIDVNILGHIFENSLNDIDEMHAEVTGAEFDKSKTKRKKDGVFYTPSYITKYIVENTIGVLCEDTKKELGLNDITLDTSKDYKRLSKDKQILLDNLHKYREYISSLKILDPACGSGAFLNQALEYLIEEHRFIDLYRRPLEGDTLGIYDVRSSILENNLYGVDINEESVELARLSLWLRTAERGRKLNDLSKNIKCGNSLIGDESIAGELAFNWQEKFPEIMTNGGFDVVIGNPPYGAKFSDPEKKYIREMFNTMEGEFDSYIYFIEKSIQLLKKSGYQGFIIPNNLLLQKYSRKLREYILGNMTIHKIIDLGLNVFPDAVVPTLIISMSNNTSSENNIAYIKNFTKESLLSKQYSFISQRDFSLNTDYQFNLNISNKLKSFVNKIHSDTLFLTQICELKIGIEGAPEYISDKPLNEIYKPLIRGRNFNRYSIDFNSDPKYILYDRKLLHRPREERLFTVDRKILIRQTGDCIIATIDENKYYAWKSVFVLLSDESIYHLNFILCLINSKLLNYYYYLIVGEENRTFAQVKGVNLDKIPIKITAFNDQKPFILLADKMFSLNKTFNSKRLEVMRG
jgi:type I restriction-modification system DNA methylase subunit